MMQETRIVEPPTSRVRRCAESALFVGLWMGLGWYVPIEGITYLLLSVPLTLLFHVGIRDRPLASAWVKDAPPFRLDVNGILIGVGLATLPTVLLIGCLIRGNWPQAGWMASAAAGSFAAAYALVHLRDWRAMILCWLVVGGLGNACFAAWLLTKNGSVSFAVETAVLQLPLYFCVCFVLEEVVFRGVLDAHVTAGEPDRGPWRWLSALYVSILWGLWHLPLMGHLDAAAVILSFPLHALVGVPLSLYWRRSGNLAVPAFAHAWIDAVRDGLIAGAAN